MTSTNVQGFKARGKAFGIVVTVLLSSRLHPIPSPRESIWHCLLSLSSRLHLIPSPRESIWHCCDNVAVFPSTPDSKPGGKALRALLCPHSFPPFFLFIFFSFFPFSLLVSREFFRFPRAPGAQVPHFFHPCDSGGQDTGHAPVDPPAFFSYHFPPSTPDQK